MTLCMKSVSLGDGVSSFFAVQKTLFIFLSQFIRGLTLSVCGQFCVMMAEYECDVMVTV